MLLLLLTLIVFCLSYFIVNLRMRFNYRGVLLLIMFLCFGIAFFGLAFYSEYIASASYVTNPLFASLSHYIWKLDYILKMDIYKSISLVNFGVLGYCCCAICFSTSYLIAKRKRRRGIFAAIIAFFLILNVVYNPYFLSWCFKLKEYNPYKVNAEIDAAMDLLTVMMSIFIKACIVMAVALQIVGCLRTCPRDRRVFGYMLIGLLPVHALFSVMFYWYPQSSQVILWRYSMLKGYTLAMSKNAYNVLVYLCVISILILLYAATRYDNFHLYGSKERVEFSNQLDTARMGVYVFSHSIKNYFAAIRLLSGMMADMAEEERLSSIGRITEICDEAIDKVAAVSSNLVSIELNYELMDIGACIHAAVEKQEGCSETLSFNTCCPIGVRTWIDRAQFSQVMDNLLTNAREAAMHMPDARIVVEMKKSLAGIRIAVRDNGTGIPKKDLSRIFHPFFSTKSTALNWGVGLSHCKAVIQSFGGTISASCPGIDGRGTAFKICLPRVWQCGMEVARHDSLRDC